MRFYLLVMLCVAIALGALAAPVHDSEQALKAVEKALLPGGMENITLSVWGPVEPGREIRSTLGLVMIAPAAGYVIYIDDHPTANLFHPVRYAFVTTSEGEVTVVKAQSPPLNYTDYEPVETAIGTVLRAVENRRAPLPEKAPPPSRSNRWAVLMNGGYGQFSNYPRYWNDLSNIYITLNWTYGFADDHIIVLCSDGLNPAPDQSNGQNSDPDLDGDGDDDIMYPCVPGAIDAVFDSLANVLTSDDLLFVFATDHGSSNGGWNTVFNLWNQQELTDAHFASLLELLPDCEIVCTFEPCYSGGFLDDVVVPPGPRVASSACDYNQVSYAMPPDYMYDTYVFHWTAAVKGEDAYGVPVDADYNGDGIVTMDEAFIYAEEHDQSNEDPQYADEPHGIGAEISLWPSGPPGDVSISLTPYGTPIQIPGSGGDFEYNVAITNNETAQQWFNCWIDVTLPSGAVYGPVVGPIYLELPGGASIDRDRVQTVPGSAPAGTYTYNAYVGVSSGMVWDQDSFTFVKTSSGEASGMSYWESAGEPLGELTPAGEKFEKPEDYRLCSNYPNPFNPMTAISYQLEAVSFVNLTVYDTGGREIVELVNGWRDAGIHQAAFDASNLASGVYIYRITAGDFNASGKMVLMK
ncbi:MAG TPA: T9SS type A sorting domain-containing protein [Bacteroidetes bacterium]|nr:T9SS type A sorting domain-containing protein [Bacteroidota bacterium]